MLAPLGGPPGQRAVQSEYNPDALHIGLNRNGPVKVDSPPPASLPPQQGRGVKPVLRAGFGAFVAFSVIAVPSIITALCAAIPFSAAAFVFYGGPIVGFLIAAFVYWYLYHYRETPVKHVLAHPLTQHVEAPRRAEQAHGAPITGTLSLPLTQQVRESRPAGITPAEAEHLRRTRAILASISQDPARHTQELDMLKQMHEDYMDSFPHSACIVRDKLAAMGVDLPIF